MMHLYQITHSPSNPTRRTTTNVSYVIVTDDNLRTPESPSITHVLALIQGLHPHEGYVNYHKNNKDTDIILLASFPSPLEQVQQSLPELFI